MQPVLPFCDLYSSEMGRYARLVYYSFGFIGLLVGATMHETEKSGVAWPAIDGSRSAPKSVMRLKMCQQWVGRI